MEASHNRGEEDVTEMIAKRWSLRQSNDALHKAMT